jgi:hypothetical protein
MEGRERDAMQDGLDNYYWFSLPAVAWLFGRSVGAVCALAQAHTFGPPHTVGDVEYFPLFMAEIHFGKSIPLAERKGAVKAMAWLDDVTNNWRPNSD